MSLMIIGNCKIFEYQSEINLFCSLEENSIYLGCYKLLSVVYLHSNMSGYKYVICVHLCVH